MTTTPTSIPQQTATPPTTFGYTKLYHPRGPLVSLPVPPDPVEAFNHVNKCLDAGWLVNAIGLEEGEHKEQVGYVLRGIFENDGKVTPILLLYDADESHGFSFLKVYLNTEEDVRTFEQVSGMMLQTMPEYGGNDKPERGKSARIDQFIVKPRKPLTVIMKNNQKYSDADRQAAVAKGEIYKVPRRLFIRWDGIAPVESKPEAPTQPTNQSATGADSWNAQQQQGPKREQAQAWTLPQALDYCKAVGITRDELRAEIKKRWPQSEGWNMLRDTLIAQEMIQRRKQPLAPPPSMDNDIPF